jgi:hypothetical protein
MKSMRNRLLLWSISSDSLIESSYPQRSCIE